MPTRGELLSRLTQAIQRSTMWTVLLHNATATKAGMNVTDAQCLNLLVMDGPQTPGRLAQVMGITTGGAITAVIDRLERAGYVKRTRDPDDRRRVLVEPLMENVAKFAAYFGPIGRASAEVFDTYTDEQLEFLLRHLQVTNDQMPDVLRQIHEMP